MTDLAVQLNDVGKRYSHFELQLDSLEMAHGSIMGFIGANGAGKSTSLKLMMGLIKPDRGSVRALGHDMLRDADRAKWDIGFVSEDLRLYEAATLEWHMEFMRSIYPTWDETYARHLLQGFDLHAKKRLKGFSHGQRVKAMLLLALARRPRLLMLDEPTTGLDPVARHEVLGELMAVLEDERRSVIFSSQNTQDVEQISDQITFVDRGRVVNSSDKESYLQGWRRLRLEVPSDVKLPELPEVVSSQGSGRLVVVTTDRYDAEMGARFHALGATVQAVETMTLEEIFVENVQHRRRQQGAT
jgi:ABC-2 type transport system ATP-binding protein